MRKLSLFWLIHFVATVAGWYSLGALAQGVVDSTGSAPASLDLLNKIIQILCLPIVVPAMSVWPSVGGFSLGSFIAFSALAAINSAVIVAVVGALIRAMKAR